jgi:fucose permease
VPASLAGLFAGSYWATFTVGRILAGWAARKTRIETLLWAGVFGALAGALLVLWNPSQWVSLTGVALTGFSVAPIFPGMVSTTAQRVSPRYAANTIGMQISAAGLGGALLPGLAGVLAQNFGLEVIPLFLVALIVLLIVLFVLSKK